MKSLRVNIYIQIIVLIIATNIITGIFSFISSTKDIDKHLNLEAEQISNRIAQSLAFPFWNLDSMGVSEIIDAQIQSSNMYAITLSEQSKFNHFTQGITKDSDGKIREIKDKSTIKSPFKATSQILFEDENLGTVTVMVSDELLKSMLIKTQLTSNLIELAILILLTLPLTYVISRSFTRPLERLATAFDTVVESHFEKPVPHSEKREINSIAKIFEKVRLTVLKTFEQIRKNEKDLTTTLNSIMDGIITIDSSGNITRLNPIAEILTGWSMAKAKGLPLKEVLNLEAMNKNETPRDLVEEINSSKTTLRARAYLPIQDNKNRTIDISSATIKDMKQNETGKVIVIRDVTEQLLVEEELRQSRKMESLGQLSGGVAHDFNNMLGGIIGFAEILRLGIEHDSKEERYVNNILEAATNAADLTAKLLAFSRKGKMVSTIFDIHNSCESAISLLSRTINKNIKIIPKLDAQHSNITGDPAQIQNVILNLCINAKDAMPSGGTITMESFDEDLPIGNSYNLKPGDYIRIVITDTGTGIPQNLLKKIFEPFFTTKGVGKGTGLGLAAVYGAIKNHHGDVFVQSIENEGTTFTILLPVIIGAQSTNINTEQKKEETLKKNILIVDDERIIRSMLDSIITELGGTTLQAIDGQDAIEIFTKYHNDIDAVILDMVMPNMNGDICFHKLQEIDNTVPVFVSSGFDKNTSISTLLEAGAAGYLHKPFTIDELKAVLYKIAQ